MGSYIKETWGNFSGLIKEAITLFAIATAVSLILFVIADLVCEEDSFCDNILKKLAEAFTFIAAASLTGAVYIKMSELKTQARNVGVPNNKFTYGGDTFVLKQYYVKE